MLIDLLKCGRGCHLVCTSAYGLIFFLGLASWVFFDGNPSHVILPWLFAVSALALLLALMQFARLPYILVLTLLSAALLNFAAAQVQSFAIKGLECCVAAAGAFQAAGNLLQRNNFGSLMALGALSALWCARFASLAKPLRYQSSQLFFSACVFLFGLGSAQTVSRTALVVTFALIFMCWLWRLFELVNLRRKMIAYVLGCLTGVVLQETLGYFSLGQSFSNRLADPGTLSRIQLWSNVVELIAREPLLGHRWRSLAYAHYSSDFSSARFMEMLDNAHNLPLHLAVELGLPVALAFCGLVGWLVWKGRPWKEKCADRQLAWGVLLVIGIHSMLEYPLWYGPFFMTAVIAVGILFADAWKKWQIDAVRNGQDAIILGVRGLAALLLAATTFVAFDYHRVSQIYLQPQERSTWYAADPLGAAKKSVLFQSHAKFAELQITPLSKESAPRVFELSSELVRWSPEPRIIEKLIESSVMMGLDDMAAFHLKRYRINYPAAYALWSQRASLTSDS